MNNELATKKPFWFFNRQNRLIVGNVMFHSFEEARSAAKYMNREGAHSTLGFVEFISDANTVTGGRVTTVDPPVQMTLA